MKFNINKKIELLLLTLVFIIPFNFHYILNFSAVQDFQFFSESLKYSLYLFDVLFLVIALFWFHQKYKEEKLLRLFKSNLILLLIIVYLIWNSFEISFNLISSLYISYRLAEILFLFLIFIDFVKNKKFLNQIIYLIFISGVAQSVIALFQFIFQKSLGLKYLGESVLTPQILGVAKLEIAGEKFIRSYGTFPHPNLLGAFLLMSLLSGLYLTLNHNPKIPFSLPLKFRKINLTTKSKILFAKTHFFLGLILILSGILSSFSRSVWLIAAIISLFLALRYSRYLFAKKYPLKYSLLAVAIIITLLIGFSRFIPSRLCLGNCQDNSSTLRTEYSNFCKENILRNNYWFGVGAGQFTIIFKIINPRNLPSYNIQPIHNLYLLTWSEIGLIGLILLILFIIKNFQNFKFSKKSEIFILLFLGFLFLGFFDHYFWSLPQGQLIFWLALALLVISGKIKK